MSRAEKHASYNNLLSGTGKETRLKVVRNTLPTAYFFVYEHLDVIRSWDRLVEDPAFRTSEGFWKTGILTNFSSHHNSAYRYMGDCISGGVETLPENERYRRLILSTDNGYSQLNRKAIRYVFTGEEVLAEEDPGRIITLEELQRWMFVHSSKPDGLIAGVGAKGVQNRTELKEIDSGNNLVRYFIINGVDQKDNDWIEKVDQAFFGRFSTETLKLAVQKIACGMAVIDQVIKESANLGIVVPIDYHPRHNDPDDPRELPLLMDLWNQGRQLVEALADPNNTLLNGLFRSTSLSTPGVD